MPVALALWLLAGDRTDVPVARRLGLDLRRPLADLGAGVAARRRDRAYPVSALYLVGHALGITATIVPAALNAYWWTVPVLVLQAVKNAVLEEVIVVGYLLDAAAAARLSTRGSRPASAPCSAARTTSTRASGRSSGTRSWAWCSPSGSAARGRVMPLIVAHTILDTVSFVGYQLLRSFLHLP